MISCLAAIQVPTSLDGTAVSLDMDNGLPIVVFDLIGAGKAVRAVRGEQIGALAGRNWYARDEQCDGEPAIGGRGKGTARREPQ